MHIPIHIIDLNFLSKPNDIAVFLVPHADGAALVECGPGSTLSALQAGLRAHGFAPAEVTDVFVTHIHLDHAGSAGWWARQGARIHVHPNGAPHLLDPQKLLASAARIYGDLMDTLWGEFLPVPPEHLSMLQDGEMVEVGGLRFRALDTPGHASHHFVYLLDGTCFTGDVGGIRIAGLRHLRLPTPPPDFHAEKWRESLARLRAAKIERLALTHFGIFDDVDWHLDAIGSVLDGIDDWMARVLPDDPPIEVVRQKFVEWEQTRAAAEGLDDSRISAYEAANPALMSADGVWRYWKKWGAAKSAALLIS